MAKAESQAAADAMIAPVAQQLRERIGAGYYGDDDTTPGGAIVAELVRRGKTLAWRSPSPAAVCPIASWKSPALHAHFSAASLPTTIR